MLGVAASERVMLECGDDPELADLSLAAERLRDLATQEIRKRTSEAGG